MRLPAVLAVMAGLCISLAGQAWAAEPYRLVFSPRLGAQLFAARDEAASWCGEQLRLHLVLSEGSPLLSGGANDFLGKLGLTLDQECPQAKTAVVAVETAAGATLGAPRLMVRDREWTVRPAADQARKPAPAAGTPPAPAAKPAQSWTLEE